MCVGKYKYISHTQTQQDRVHRPTPSFFGRTYSSTWLEIEIRVQSIYEPLCRACPHVEVEAVGVKTISRGCFERCGSNKKTPPYHSNKSFLNHINQRHLG